ncbi:MAG: hypothetical protein OEY55_07455 [Acidimicrobiia bacterium]|nr:hypothetical protein [Acidimicrobiia bacterium]MDH5421622.1 hypothetical protein [Acidimicrobiia bacterium]MDH5502478.1 hypothetical protein [Acidimicrobiia bacterium]
MEFTLLWAALAGVGTIWATDRWLNEADRRFDDLLGAALIGLAVGRLATMIGDGSYPWEHPGLILLVRAGVHPGWASAAALGWLAVRFRSSQITLEAMAVPALMGLSGWEAGCVFRSACGGVMVGSSALPIGLIAAAAFVGAAVLVHRFPPPTKAGAALLAAGAIRSMSEPFRSALTHSIIWWYLVAIVVGSIVVVRQRRHPASFGTG